MEKYGFETSRIQGKLFSMISPSENATKSRLAFGYDTKARDNSNRVDQTVLYVKL